MPLRNFYDLNHLLNNRETILIEEFISSAKASVISYSQKLLGSDILILTGSTTELGHLYHDLPFFTDREILELPAWESLPGEEIDPAADIVGSRYQALKEILRHRGSSIVICNLQAALQKLISPESFRENYLEIGTGEEFSFEKLIATLENMGYVRSPLTCDKGEFSVRGGIIDIFSLSNPEPYRLEFFGDVIESVRTFDPVGQRTIAIIEKAEISPSKEPEMLKREKKRSSIFDYLSEKRVVVFDDLLTLEESYSQLAGKFRESSHFFLGLEDFFKEIAPLQKIYFAPDRIERLCEISRQEKKISFRMFNRKLRAVSWRSPFLPLTEFLLPEKKEREPIFREELLSALPGLPADYQLRLICQTEKEKENLRKSLLDLGTRLPRQTEYIIGYLSRGYALPESKTLLFPMTEITHHYKIRRQKIRSSYHTTPSDIHPLVPGDMVVHLKSGIGKFLGVETQPDHLGSKSEFFVIEYADNAKLFVPLNQSHLISKYIGTSEELPQLHSIDGKSWQRIRKKTEEALFRYAGEILRLNAARELKGGFAFPPDSPEMMAFEEEFPFEETEDQLQAIRCVKKDMQSAKAMDRLICGDVGYGKTELAMRAAFKAVTDGGKQVAMLTPTTVLAMQHFETFAERMRNFNVNVVLLSRFDSNRDTRKTLANIADGKIDIVIGTHRLISKDVCFKDLGLIIIDEEQRFGVRAKEHLKKIKTGVDCLTLSATPIPRTLYLSLVGARDMSIINTPPQDRLPIKTIIAEPQESLIKQALQRELARGGQTYAIHNRVETLPAFAQKIHNLLPKAKIVVAHGRMAPKDIDRAFHLFKNGEADILAATSIVENGLDIPNANTIIIDNADRFGLADLYQLRGRVGRWNRPAFAYFLIPEFRILPAVTKKRLQALAESSGYGGGMKLAMRDLEIRGAGNILGLEQSGHVSAVGFYLYCKMLKKMIGTLRGEIPEHLTETEIEVPYKCDIPEKYIPENYLRADIYRRLGEAVTVEETENIFEELRDRFGSWPPSLFWLYRLQRIKICAQRHAFTRLRLKNDILYAEIMGLKRSVPVKEIKSPQDFEEKLIKAMEEICREKRAGWR